jgi:hypothetical protein
MRDDVDCTKCPLAHATGVWAVNECAECKREYSEKQVDMGGPVSRKRVPLDPVEGDLSIISYGEEYPICIQRP